MKKLIILALIFLCCDFFEEEKPEEVVFKVNYNGWYIITFVNKDKDDAYLYNDYGNHTYKKEILDNEIGATGNISIQIEKMITWNYPDEGLLLFQIKQGDEILDEISLPRNTLMAQIDYLFN